MTETLTELGERAGSIESSPLSSAETASVGEGPVIDDSPSIETESDPRNIRHRRATEDTALNMPVASHFGSSETGEHPDFTANMEQPKNPKLDRWQATQHNLEESTTSFISAIQPPPEAAGGTAGVYMDTQLDMPGTRASGDWKTVELSDVCALTPISNMYDSKNYP